MPSHKLPSSRNTLWRGRAIRIQKTWDSPGAYPVMWTRIPIWLPVTWKEFAKAGSCLVCLGAEMSGADFVIWRPILFWAVCESCLVPSLPSKIKEINAGEYFCTSSMHCVVFKCPKRIETLSPSQLLAFTNTFRAPPDWEYTLLGQKYPSLLVVTILRVGPSWHSLAAWGWKPACQD